MSPTPIATFLGISISSVSLGVPMRMGVPVVQIGVMRMLVHERHVSVAMRVRLARGVAGFVRVLMMHVVRVPMLVLEGFVHMFVLMRLGEMQINAACHQQTGDDEQRPHGFAEQCDCNDRADERRRREVGAGACRAEMS